MVTYKIIVSGKVQGVFYRASAKEIADQLNLTGWVKNTKEDDVEIMVTGERKNVEDFVEWCKQGPRRAKVTQVQVNEVVDQSFMGFTILR